MIISEDNAKPGTAWFRSGDKNGKWWSASEDFARGFGDQFDKDGLYKAELGKDIAYLTREDLAEWNEKIHGTIAPRLPQLEHTLDEYLYQSDIDAVIIEEFDPDQTILYTKSSTIWSDREKIG
jgi:hypothetical protein